MQPTSTHHALPLDNNNAPLMPPEEQNTNGAMARSDGDNELVRLAEQGINLAEHLDAKFLADQAQTLLRNINTDESSVERWMLRNDEFLKLAAQIYDKKSFPWQNASNVKYPLLTIASLQFQSRAYAALISSPNIVKGRVIGKDEMGLKRKKAQRISTHMSWQLLEEMESWQEDMDKLCLLLPICGNVFKKIYFDGEKNVSEIVLPQDIIINYYAKNINKAQRITHKVYLYRNEIEELVRENKFLDIPEYDSECDKNPEQQSKDKYLQSTGHSPPQEDTDSPCEFYECHCFVDLDDDGYKEPYVVTIHKSSEKIVRIAPRYGSSNILFDEKGKIVKITPINYFENYIFVQDPISGIYGLGFGSLLAPINEASNTLINQLIDSGTLNNLPSGFLSRGVRVQGGDSPLRPGEFRYVNVTGDDLRKGIVPIPSQAPSPVLFNLLGMLVQSGQQIASVTDTLLGQQPGQNTPFSTTAAVIDQGLKVFSSIFKRIYRSFGKELKKLYRLNRLYLPQEKYFSILDEQGLEQQGMVASTDYTEDETDVVPGADPDLISDAQNLQKAQAVYTLLQAGTVNPQVATRRLLEALNINDIEELMTLPPPQPSFDQQLEMKKLELEAQRVKQEEEILTLKASYQAMRDEANSLLLYAQAQTEAGKTELEKMKMYHESQINNIKMELEKVKLLQNHVKMDQEENTKVYNQETGSFD